MEHSFTFKPAFARRIPDPNFKKEYGMEKHIFLMPCSGLPAEIGDAPNARTPNTNKGVYKEVAKSLLQEDGSEKGTFHLKNKGITIIAKSVEQSGDNEYCVVMEANQHGIVDGGHTYKIIQENEADIPSGQFVQVEVRTGIPDLWIPDIAGGLNTSVQVQDMSLDHLKGKFQWIKETLGPKARLIAWSENEDGHLTARDLVTLMCLFNVSLYPNHLNKHPTSAYVSPKSALKSYQDEQASFEAMQPILLNILELYELIASSARGIWNEEKGAKAGRLEIIENRKRGKFQFPFSGQSESEYRLWKPVLYPMLAAFRQFAKRNATGDLKIRWQVDFEEIKAFWREHGRELMEIAYDTSKELKYNLNAVGKNGNYWDNAHSKVGIRAMQAGLIKP